MATYNLTKGSTTPKMVSGAAAFSHPVSAIHSVVVDISKINNGAWAATETIAIANVSIGDLIGFVRLQNTDLITGAGNVDLGLATVGADVFHANLDLTSATNVIQRIGHLDAATGDGFQFFTAVDTLQLLNNSGNTLTAGKILVQWELIRFGVVADYAAINADD